MHRFVSRQSTRISSQWSNSTNSKLQTVQQLLTELNDGQIINVNSPKQVSQAIFGRFQSTSRPTLLRATLDGKKRTMANLVLEARELIKTQTEGEILRNNIVCEASQAEQGSIVERTSAYFEPRQLESPKSAFDVHVESLFDPSFSKINVHWKDPMLRLTKPSSRNMVLQFTPNCPMGYDPQATASGINSAGTTTAGKQGSLLHYCREQKERYSHCVVLTRVGDFYEAFGVDAALMVEHCGLNPMGGKGRAGCPIQNVQATLDDLTQVGYSIAVLEEVTETDSERGPSRSPSRLKTRMLGQIVSPANPTYLHDLLLGDNGVLFNAPPSRPYAAIMYQKSGATYLEVSVEERSVQVSYGLTPEAVSCRLSAYPPAEPVIYAGMLIPNFKLRTVLIPPALLPEKDPEKGLMKLLLQHIEGEELAIEDFRWFFSQQNGVNPLYVETASQLGLMNDPSIPSLIRSILPESAPAATKRFLRRWMLIPPTLEVSESMATVVKHLKEQGVPLPPLSVPPVGKIVSLIRAGQASAQVYGDLLAAIDSTLQSLNVLKGLHDPFMLLLKHESGIGSTVETLRERCEQASGLIEDIISPIHHVRGKAEDQVSNYGEIVPRGFFERNEESWRGRVQPCAAASLAYKNVEDTSMRLAFAVASDFWGFHGSNINELMEAAKNKKSPIVQDIFNNMIAVKERPVNRNGVVSSIDRFGKIIGNRYTTEIVQVALSAYVEACNTACDEVTRALTVLSERICEEGHLPAIVQAAHFNLILSTASLHAAKANKLGWSMAKTYSRTSEHPLKNKAGKFVGLWPYWMDKSDAIPNSFDLDGIFFLTAPNMSGKSTLMRSTGAVALLTSCGLCAPLCPDSEIRRFDNIFVRGASADVPTENKSAFGAEMGEIAALLRSSGHDSLVFVDELGRGTSPRDGTCIAAAVLESMAGAGINGIFATHLHAIIDLPLLDRDRIQEKRMAINDDMALNGNVSWTYQIENGVCTESMALVTAARFGLASKILNRAASFSDFLNTNERSMRLVKKESPKSRSTPKPKNILPNESLGLVEACKVIGCSSTAMQIPPRWQAPSSLEGTSCVYILELNVSPRDCRYYVGETDSIGQRLKNHRAKGGAWTQATAAAFVVSGGKTQARNLESLAIQKLAQAGFNLISTSDGRSIRPVGQQ